MSSNMSILKKYSSAILLNYLKLSKLFLNIDKKKALSIAATFTFVLGLIYGTNKLIRPPKKLRHIPHQSFFQFCQALLKNESITERTKDYSQKHLDKKDSTGLYLRPGRLGWEVQVTDPESIKRILMKHEFFVKTYNPSGNTSALSYKFTGRNISILTGEPWKKLRKVINPAFHRAMPVHMFGVLTKKMFTAIEDLGDVVDATDMMERFALDAIGNAGFGFDFNAISDRDSELVKNYNIIRIGNQDPLFFLFPELEKYFLWMFPKRREVHRCLAKFHEMVDRVIAEKKAMLKTGTYQNPYLGESEKDILTLMLEADEQGEITNEQLKNNVSVFFVAGHDTTASTLASVLYYLSKNPDIQEKARQEAIDILGDEPEDVMPKPEDLKQMRYITQIIKETLRMNGPVTTMIPREATENTELSNTFIPKGTLLTVNIYETHFRETFWDDPLTFNPDRFGEEQEKTRKGMSWVPFGNGARQCLGMGFSYAEQQVMLSMLLRKYNLILPKDSIHQNGLVTPGMTLIAPTRLDIIFKKRY